MQTLFRKVSAKERLPKEDGDYFVYTSDEDEPGLELHDAMHFSDYASDIWKKEVIYWLEEIKLAEIEIDI